jgi:hypothetical protein
VYESAPDALGTARGQPVGVTSSHIEQEEAAMTFTKFIRSLIALGALAALLSSAACATTASSAPGSSRALAAHDRDHGR